MPHPKDRPRTPVGFFIDDMRLTPLDQESDEDRRSSRALVRPPARSPVCPTARPPSVCPSARPSVRSPVRPPARQIVHPSARSSARAVVSPSDRWSVTRIKIIKRKNETHAKTSEIQLTCFERACLQAIPRIALGAQQRNPLAGAPDVFRAECDRGGGIHPVRSRWRCLVVFTFLRFSDKICSVAP